MQNEKALIRLPGEGELVPVAGVDHLFLLTAAETEGRFAFEEFTLAPGVLGARPHVHAEHDEYFYVLDGTLTIHTGEEEVHLEPGSLAAAVRGTPHGFRNASDETVRALCLYTPAGYENYFRDVHAAAAAGAPITDALLTTHRARYNTTPY
jgi:quercetin dioxygenase-like cupin family protein